MDKTPTSATAIVTYVDATDPKVCGITYGGEIFEAYDTYELGVAVGQSVLVDYLPGASQWIVIAIIA